MWDLRWVYKWVMLCVIPAIAITVAARQLYLSTTGELSTWKGGGMGMFASSEQITRYVKIYLIFADGRRQHDASRQRKCRDPNAVHRYLPAGRFGLVFLCRPSL